MTPRWWLFAIVVGVAVELLARLVPGGNVWADRIVTTLGIVAAGVIVARRFRQT
jgi:hypothetical protein